MVRKADKKQRLIQALQKRVQREYDRFRRYTMHHNKTYIYCNSDRIFLYEVLFEYFNCSPFISDEALLVLGKCKKVLLELWETYQKNEFLQVRSWQQVDDLITQFINEKERIKL